jgi:RNA polymerase sigma-70 factor (ECF subfamily)
MGPSDTAASCPPADQLGSQLSHLRPRLTSVALRIVRCRDAAEDIVQNAFEKAVRNLHQFDGRALFSTWLHRIVVNEALMWRRAERRIPIPTADAEGLAERQWSSPLPRVHETIEARQRDVQVRAMVARLPAADREVIEQCALGDVTYEELSGRLGQEAGALKSRAYRARMQLKRSLTAL